MTNTDPDFARDHPQNKDSGRFEKVVPSTKEIDDLTPASTLSVSGGSIHVTSPTGDCFDFLPNYEEAEPSKDITPRAITLDNGNTKLTWASQSTGQFEFANGDGMMLFNHVDDVDDFIEQNLADGVAPGNIFLYTENPFKVVRYTDVAGTEDHARRPNESCGVLVMGSLPDGTAYPIEYPVTLISNINDFERGTVYIIRTLEFEDGVEVEGSYVEYPEQFGRKQTQRSIDNDEY